VKLPDGTIPKAPPFLKKKPAVEEAPKVSVSQEAVKESPDDQGAVSGGSFAGLLHVTVHKIDEFSDTAGFLDRTDPDVLLQIGRGGLQSSRRKPR